MKREPVKTSTAVVALFLVLCVAAGGAVSALVRYDLIGFGHLPRTAMIAVVLLLLANLLSAALLRRRLFTTAQLLYVYIAVLVMSGFPGQQMVTYLYVSLVGPAHYASPENHFRELFFEHIPPWSTTSLSAEAPVVKWAFWGMPSGASIPWQPWVVPLAAWSVFFLLLFLNYVFLAGLFRRQWVDRQRMLFPLAEIPFQITRYQGAERIPGPFRSVWFWLAFAVPLVILSLNGLHFHYPQIRGVDIYPRYLQNAFRGRPWDHLNGIAFNFYFDVIGITYLLPSDVSLSLWLLWLFKYGLRVARSAVGRPENENAFRHMGIGSYLLLGLLTIWQARGTLAEIYRRAVRPSRPSSLERTFDDEAQEIVPGPLAFWGFVLTTLGVVFFTHLLGADWPLALLAHGLFLLSALVVARLVSEAGLYAVWSPIGGSESLISQAFGPLALGARNVTALVTVSFHNGDTASLTLASIFQGYKLADLGRLRPRHTLLLICAALALGIVGSHPTALYSIYSRGIPALGWWMRGAGAGLPYGIANRLNNPEAVFTAGHYGNMGVGAAIVLVLSLLHVRYLWWPIHPLAWAATFSSIVSERFGFSFLLGWLLHRLALKAGGFVAYKRYQPLVLGLIVGNGVTLLAWAVIHYFYPISGALVIE